ncbi:Cyclin M transmembrane [Gracilaria domingensis]|nr:Cyclin M transmembrane [Gracilaria domingensis]
MSIPWRPTLTAAVSGNALPASLAHITTHSPSSSDEKPPLQRSLLVLACVMFTIAAALAAAETAITTLWPWKVRELAEKEGEKSPFAVLESDLTRFLTTILVSTTSATIFSTAIATELAGEVFGTAAVGYVTAALTIFFLFFGEILPKAVAVHAPAKVARIMVPFINTLSIIVYPVGKLLAAVSTFILRILKLPLESDTTVSEEELRLIVAGADRSGSIEKYESQIIHNVLDLEETDVKSIMCPRVDMVAIPNNNTMTQLLGLETESHYSRMPVYEGTIDNIVGIALAKSLLRYLNEDPELLQKTKVAEVMEPAFFVPESMSVWVALEEMRKRRLHMAVVVDEYGGTAGLVTLEDILEEVVGEIYDEDDDYEAEAQFIASIGDSVYTVNGQTSLEKVAQAFNLVLSEDDLDDYGTISGFLCAQMGGIPEVDEEVIISQVRFKVTEANDRRIIRLRAEILTEEEIAKITEEEQRLKESEVEVENQDLKRNVLDVEPAPKKQKQPNGDNDGTSESSATRQRIEGFSQLD